MSAWKRYIATIKGVALGALKRYEARQGTGTAAVAQW